MTADSDRHLARFERGSPLALSMGISADLGIALVIVGICVLRAIHHLAERAG